MVRLARYLGSFREAFPETAVGSDIIGTPRAAAGKDDHTEVTSATVLSVSRSEPALSARCIL